VQSDPVGGRRDAQHPAGLRRGQLVPDREGQRLLPIGVAYGVWAATGVALTAIIGRLLFKDPLTWLMGAGIACIIAGVFLIELGH